jgi:hypothetical protein
MEGCSGALTGQGQFTTDRLKRPGEEPVKFFQEVEAQLQTSRISLSATILFAWAAHLVYEELPGESNA